MDVLLVEKDPLVRDLIKVGLQQFEEFQVTVGRGYAGINELRSRHFDCVFLGLDPADKHGLRLLQHLRSFDTATELYVMAPMAALRAKEFFGLVGRFLERRTDRQGSTLRKRPRAAAPAHS